MNIGDTVTITGTVEKLNASGSVGVCFDLGSHGPTLVTLTETAPCIINKATPAAAPAPEPIKAPAPAPSSGGGKPKDEKAEIEELRAQLDEKGVKYHPAQRAASLRKLLEEQTQ